MNIFALAINVSIYFFVFTVNIVFSELFEIPDIYKLPKLNENFASYKNSVVRGSNGNDYKYIKMFDDEEFYNITHNLENRKIPKKRNGTYTYEVYSKEYIRYCLEEHSSYDLTMPLPCCIPLPPKVLQNKCLDEMADRREFDMLGMQHLFFPQPVDRDVNEYTNRIINLDIIKEAREACASADFNKNYKMAESDFSFLYKTYIENTPLAKEMPDNIKQYYLKRLSGRRALKDEMSYKLYASRILAKGFYPLSYELWVEEVSALMDWQQSIQDETLYIN